MRLIHEYVENMQFGHSKLGVHLIHECVLYTRRYGMLKICSLVNQNLGCVLYTSASYTRDGTVLTGYVALLDLESAEERQAIGLGVVTAGSTQGHDLDAAALEQQHLILHGQLSETGTTRRSQSEDHETSGRYETSGNICSRQGKK